MRKLHAALDTVISTACGAAAMVVLLPMLLLTTPAKTMLTAPGTADRRPLTPGLRTL
jgi:hypothetical protein